MARWVDEWMTETISLICTDSFVCYEQITSGYKKLATACSAFHMGLMNTHSHTETVELQYQLHSLTQPRRVTAALADESEYAIAFTINHTRFNFLVSSTCDYIRPSSCNF